MIRGILLDLSGVLYSGNEVLPGALDAVRKIGAAGLPVRFITNTTRKTSRTILDQLRGMQFDIHPDQLFTAPLAARDYLESHRLNPWLLVHPELVDEFPAADSAKKINAVLVGDAADAFSYASMNTAFRYLLDGALLLAMGDNRYFRDGDAFSLDAGPFVHALEYATDSKATVIGKPAADFYHSAVRSLGCRPEETLMVGDDVDADVLGAVAAGLQAALVRTGKYRPGDDEKLHGKAVCVADVAAAVALALALDNPA